MIASCVVRVERIFFFLHSFSVFYLEALSLVRWICFAYSNKTKAKKKNKGWGNDNKIKKNVSLHSREFMFYAFQAQRYRKMVFSFFPLLYNFMGEIFIRGRKFSSIDLWGDIKIFFIFSFFKTIDMYMKLLKKKIFHIFMWQTQHLFCYPFFCSFKTRTSFFSLLFKVQEVIREIM